MKTRFIYWMMGLVLPTVMHGQGTFQNLDFESANLSPVSAGLRGGAVPISSALPGWSGLLGTSPVTSVLQNNYDTRDAGISILGPNWNSGNGNPGIIGGSYTVDLQPGLGPGGTLVGTSLFQSGTIPANAESLQFKAESFEGSAPLSVSFAGDSLTLFAVSSGVAPSGQPYTVYGANISPFAGETGQLQFTATLANAVELDDISLSPSAVPEPSPVVSFGIAGLLFAGYWSLKRVHGALMPRTD